MIDPKLFTVESLLAALLNDRSGNRNAWRVLTEIVPDYMPPFPDENTRPRCVVRCPAAREANGCSFLRGPPGATWWDIYGDDYRSPDVALEALLSAPVPPSLMSNAAWAHIRNAKGLLP